MMDNTREEKPVVIVDDAHQQSRRIGLAMTYALEVIAGMQRKGLVERCVVGATDAANDELTEFVKAGGRFTEQEVYHGFLLAIQRGRVRVSWAGLATLFVMAFPFERFCGDFIEVLAKASGEAPAKEGDMVYVSDTQQADLRTLLERINEICVDNSFDTNTAISPERWLGKGCEALEAILGINRASGEAPPAAEMSEMKPPGEKCDRCGIVAELFPHGENCDVLCSSCKKQAEAEETADGVNP